MRHISMFRFCSILSLGLFLAGCPEDQAPQGPTGPPGQPDTAWGQQMAAQHKEKQKTEREKKYKRNKDLGLKLADDSKRRNEAIAHLDSAMNLAKQVGISKEEQQNIKKRLADLHLVLGQEALRQKSYDEARLAMVRAENLIPGMPGVKSGLTQLDELAEKRYAEAEKIQKSKPEEALAKLAQIVAMTDSASPLHKKANALRGQLLATRSKAARDAEVAKGSFDKAGATDALTRSRLLRADGIDLQNQGKHAEAIERFKESLDNNPTDHDLNRLIGASYVLIGDRRKAKTHYKRYTLRCDDCSQVETVRKILAKMKETKF
ncbi:MAG: hypothetical protein JRF33_07850 [Deltaproteobacteria bacterium]|nr:hypothetical protein [Deltaproteobacteria bacterium]